MRVAWTPRASAQLEAIADFIAERDPEAALRVTRRIIGHATRVADFPLSGRLGRVAGTRELVIPRTAYIAVYRVRDGVVEIVAVLHGAQDWPEEFPDS